MIYLWNAESSSTNCNRYLIIKTKYVVIHSYSGDSETSIIIEKIQSEHRRLQKRAQYVFTVHITKHGEGKNNNERSDLLYYLSSINKNNVDMENNHHL